MRKRLQNQQVEDGTTLTPAAGTPLHSHLGLEQAASSQGTHGLTLTHTQSAGSSPSPITSTATRHLEEKIGRWEEKNNLRAPRDAIRR